MRDTSNSGNAEITPEIDIPAFAGMTMSEVDGGCRPRAANLLSVNRKAVGDFQHLGADSCFDGGVAFVGIGFT